MRDVPSTPAETLSRARRIALNNGVHFAYTGNVHDAEGGSTWCPSCKALLIERDWHQLGHWGLDLKRGCRQCGETLPGHFDSAPGQFGARRIPVRIAGLAGRGG